MALLRGPRPVETLTRMARLGVLGQYLPAFAQVSGRMQFDLFHVYTVDQHTLMVLRNLAGFASGVADERFSIAHEVWPRLRKPELLLLAGLFHDIAKGRGGDHSELGAVDAREFCAAHGLSDADTGLVVWLVEQHLRMSVTAQKQDISDPDVVRAFATLVGDRERLDYLYLLTCADIAGTSPKLWNAWKDRLLADLYLATRRVLREGLETPVDAEARVAEGREATRESMRALGYDDATIERQFAEMPDESFLRFRPEQLALAGRGTGRRARGRYPGGRAPDRRAGRRAGRRTGSVRALAGPRRPVRRDRGHARPARLRRAPGAHPDGAARGGVRHLRGAAGRYLRQRRPGPARARAAPGPRRRAR